MSDDRSGLDALLARPNDPAGATVGRRKLVADGFCLAGLLAGGALIAVSLPAPPVEPLTGPDFTVGVSQPEVGPTELPEPGADPDPDEIVDVNGDPLEPDGHNRLVIPALGVNSPLYRANVTGGRLEPPLPVSATGIWTGGAQIGQSSGTVLVTGHVAWNGTTGALYELVRLQPGSLAYLIDGAGQLEKFKLVAIASLHKTDLPAEVFAGTATDRLLQVITCGGEISTAANGARSYSDNVIATFVPVT